MLMCIYYEHVEASALDQIAMLLTSHRFSLNQYYDSYIGKHSSYLIVFQIHELLMNLQFLETFNITIFSFLQHTFHIMLSTNSRSTVYSV